MSGRPLLGPLLGPPVLGFSSPPREEKKLQLPLGVVFREFSTGQMNIEKLLRGENDENGQPFRRVYLMSTPDQQLLVVKLTRVSDIPEDEALDFPPREWDILQRVQVAAEASPSEGHHVVKGRAFFGTNFSMDEESALCYCLTMEFVPGISASEALLVPVIMTHRQLWLRRLCRELCLGVEFVHRQGIAHLDISLDNLLIWSPQGTPSDPRTLHLKICDFGNSRLANAELDMQNLSCKTGYRAPETIRGLPIDAQKLDVWAVGIVLFYFVLGVFPYPRLIDPRNPVVRLILDPQIPDVWNRVFAQYVPNINKGELAPTPNPAITIETRVPSPIRNLLATILNPDPGQRPTMRVILQHPYLQPP